MTKFVTKTDLKILFVISLATASWLGVSWFIKDEHVLHCRKAPWTYEVFQTEDDNGDFSGFDVSVSNDDGRIFSFRNVKYGWGGSGECGRHSFIFSLEGETTSVENIGCFPASDPPPEGAVGVVSIGAWMDKNPEGEYWSLVLFEGPDKGEWCYKP